MVSIIIPAHNEAKNIEKCLKPFIGSVNLDKLEVIVVCNGCKDYTADIVKELSSKFICLETEIPSKVNALNLGDNIASSFPRIYLDADVAISLESIFVLSEALENECLAASLETKMDLSKSSWFVRAFYDIWLNLPYCKEGMIGSGMYALSESGRKRFDKFPDIIADDGYVRCLFHKNERMLIKGYNSVVTAPNNIFDLIKIKTRSRLGRYQLKELFPHLLGNEKKEYMVGFGCLIYNIKIWPKIIVYLIINFIARIRARYQYWTNQIIWERDESSRV